MASLWSDTNFVLTAQTVEIYIVLLLKIIFYASK